VRPHLLQVVHAAKNELTVDTHVRLHRLAGHLHAPHASLLATTRDHMRECPVLHDQPSILLRRLRQSFRVEGAHDALVGVPSPPKPVIHERNALDDRPIRF